MEGYGMRPGAFVEAKCCQQKGQFALELELFKPAVLDLGQWEGAHGRVCTFLCTYAL